MVKYIHLALDERLHIKLCEIKGNMTWIEFIEASADEYHKKILREN
jgi:hypothetical protein